MADPNPGGNIYKATLDSDDRFESWNKVIQDVNELAQNPDPGCDPVETLEEVGPDHIWKDEDVEKVRDKLKEICDENEFEAELDYWMRDIIQEISDAIDNGWCGCKKCQAEDEEIVLFDYKQSCNVYLYPWTCTKTDPGENPCEDFEAPGGHFDYYTPSTAITGFGEGIGGSIRTRRCFVRGGVFTGCSIVYTNLFDCSGNQELPLPEPQYDGEGHLKNSSYGSLDACYSCATYYKSCFLWWCMCVACGNTCGGRCCEEEPTIGEDCACPFDEEWAREHCFYLKQYEDYYCNLDDPHILFFAKKYAPYEFHGEGAPCRKCCSDGIGFCDNYDCPGDPACNGGGE